MATYKVVPKPGCKDCHGSGEVSGDWVDYGSTQVQLPATWCECVTDQLPEEFDDVRDDIELVGELSEEDENQNKENIENVYEANKDLLEE